MKVIIQSDGGVFTPSGFGFTGSDEAFAMVSEIATLLDRIEADTMAVIDPDEMARCVAAMAVIAYVVADMPQRLPRVTR